MNWIPCLSRALRYIEDHLTEDIRIDDIAIQSYSSVSHFQLVFHVVMGMTVGEYIRNRRLSAAAQDLMQPDSRIIDIAMRYQYDTQESFSKAFARFHGTPPSKIQRGAVKLFHPMTIVIAIQGGFDMSRKLIDAFYPLNADDIKTNVDRAQGAEAYQQLIQWAGQARAQNPDAFDALTEWMLDDSLWHDASLEENEWMFTQGVLARFRNQNATLRALLEEIAPSGVVNAAVFGALDRFDEALSGNPHDDKLRDAVAEVFADFRAMRDPRIRRIIAGNKTGPAGTHHVDLFGYVNHLKDCDAIVQWALFMPDVVKAQTRGFTVDSFTYRRMPAMRFIGFEGDAYGDVGKRVARMRALDALHEHASGLDHDMLLMHHDGLCVDIGPWHGVWGRFMKADAPVPEGYLSIDFVPIDEDDRSEPQAGPPYGTSFAFATFSGDMRALHAREGFDVDAIYDVTRNIVLGEGRIIPYPAKYWTAEVFFDGCDTWSTGFLFSVNG